MNKQAIIVGGVGVVAGVLVGVFAAVAAVNSNNHGMMTMMGMRQPVTEESRTSGDSMSGMLRNLEGKTGDVFDETFLNEMIMHHQGAVHMAHLAKTQAKHEEIKTMADAIITTQNKEINQMLEWQSMWGYQTLPIE